MKKAIIYPIVLLFIVLFGACEKFLEPDQDLILRESEVPGDEVELRSASLGLYSIQQELVEKIVILGELRSDLQTSSDPDQCLADFYFEKLTHCWLIFREPALKFLGTD